jgi:hypothetical protein
MHSHRPPVFEHLPLRIMLSLSVGVASALSTAPRVDAGHMLSGIPIRGAGVVPYVNMPGRGVHFLLQTMQNGTRAGKLCDFGGRREPEDCDTFATAAREFCEETDFLFGVRRAALGRYSMRIVRPEEAHGRHSLTCACHARSRRAVCRTSVRLPRASAAMRPCASSTATAVTSAFF